ncbi:hypothetical protein ACFLZE_00645 [Thermodesulfobacteriota bacterium]
MRNKKRINFKMVLALLAVALLIMLPAQVLAKGKPNPKEPTPAPSPSDPPGGVCVNEPPEGDFDGDGFTNEMECLPGLVTESQNYIASFNYPSCVENPAPEERKYCLDPESKDLFIELKPLDGSDGNESILPPEPLKYVNCEGDGCLGITTHLVGNGTNIPLPPDRTVVRDVSGAVIQKALRVTEDAKIVEQFGENLDERSVPPEGKDNITIYTYRIRDYITEILGDNQDAIDTFMWHTIAHEVGHGVFLWIACSDRYGGCHQRSGVQQHMEESVKVQGGVIYTSTMFDDASITDFAMH